MSPHQPQLSTNQPRIKRLNALWELQPAGMDPWPMNAAIPARLLQEVLQTLHISQQRLNLPSWNCTAASQISGDLSIKRQAQQPSIAQGTMRHQAGLLLQAAVHLDQLAGHRAVHLPHRLDRLQGGHGVHDLRLSEPVICDENDLQMVGIPYHSLPILVYCRAGRFMARS